MPQLRAGLGASQTLFDHAQPKKPDSSRFDLSRITNLTADSGMIIPFDWFNTYPGDEFDIQNTIGLESLPTITNVLTPYRIRTHWYYMPYRHMWKGWKRTLTKGRKGIYEGQIPKVDLTPFRFDFRFVTSSTDYSYQIYNPNAYHSLSSFLGVPPSVSGVYKDESTTIGTEDWQLQPDNYRSYSYYPESLDSTDDISTGYNQYNYPCALPFFMYQAICKYNYAPANLLEDNESLFPPFGDEDFILPAEAVTRREDGLYLCRWTSGSDDTNLTSLSTTVPKKTISSPEGIYSSSDKAVSLLQLRYACFDNDYFTTALPWLTRGDEPQMDLHSDDFELEFLGEGGQYHSIKDITAVSDRNFYLTTQDSGVTIPNDEYTISASFNATFSANKLRQMLALSVWQERNAKVDGSYNSMVWTHWSQNPHSEEYAPTFIGGTSQSIEFGTILSTDSASDSPLGSVAGRGSAFGQQSIGHFTCSDYGIIMGLMIITPQTTYSDGVEHDLSCVETQEDLIFPEFQQLSPQPVLNKELFVSSDDTENENLFGYQERMTYAKTRMNQNRGLFRAKSSEDTLFSSASQSREFEDLPELSYQFLVQSPSNTRRDWLAYPSQPMFKIQVASQVYVNRALAYNAKPNTFGF